MSHTENNMQELQQKLLQGECTYNEAMAYYQLATRKGITIPPAEEELILKRALVEFPTRDDLKQRLAKVLRMQDKEIPESLLDQDLCAEERKTDHQLAAAGYHEKCGHSDLDKDFFPHYEFSRKFTMTSIERLYALYKAVEYVERSALEGDILECGVWLGGSMMLAAKMLSASKSTERGLYLFDTFEGLPEPDSAEDVDLWGNKAVDGWQQRKIDSESSYWARATYDEVQKNMISTSYPEGKIHLVKGLVENTLPDNAPEKLAILRLDTDWYSSTIHEMEHLYPRLVQGGVLIIDDYGHFQGARKAVDEYFEKLDTPPMLMRVDYTCRMAIKV